MFAVNISDAEQLLAPLSFPQAPDLAVLTKDLTSRNAAFLAKLASGLEWTALQIDIANIINDSDLHAYAGKLNETAENCRRLSDSAKEIVRPLAEGTFLAKDSRKPLAALGGNFTNQHKVLSGITMFLTILVAAELRDSRTTPELKTHFAQFQEALKTYLNALFECGKAFEAIGNTSKEISAEDSRVPVTLEKLRKFCATQSDLLPCAEKFAYAFSQKESYGTYTTYLQGAIEQLLEAMKELRKRDTEQ